MSYSSYNSGWWVGLLFGFALGTTVMSLLIQEQHPKESLVCSSIPVLRDAMVELELVGDDALVSKLQKLAVCNEGKGLLVPEELRVELMRAMLVDGEATTRDDYVLRVEVLREVVK